MSKPNINISIIDDFYHIDLSNNPKLRQILILEKLGPVNVGSLNLSNTNISTLEALLYMKIEKLILRNTGRLGMGSFSNHYTHLDAEGSKTDFSKFLKNKPVEYLNIHNTPFRNYAVLTSLKRLRTLVVSKGKLPDKVRSQLHKDCKVIEK